MEGAYYTASFYKCFSAREKKLMKELFGPSESRALARCYFAGGYIIVARNKRSWMDTRGSANYK